jgi:hypothetical protein
MTTLNLPQEMWDQELAAAYLAPPDWLWHGLVQGGNLTLLTSMWKSGKTTLLSLLLSRRKQGGQLAGFAVKPGKSVVISEESPRLWAERASRYDFGGQVCFFPQPFRSIPSPAQWQALIDRVLDLHTRHGTDLAVIDPLAPFVRGENNPRCMFDALLPLGALTRQGMAVLVLHHPGKGESRVGHAARGSTALLGHVDISIEMRHPAGNPHTRRRRFLALSRFADTPSQLLLEWNSEGTDYVPVPDPHVDEFQQNWDVLRMVFEDAEQKLTRLDILDEWPSDFDKPALATLRAWLSRATGRGLIAVEGTGRRADPFRYWLPEREAVWKEENPLYDIIELQRQQLKLPFESLRQRKRPLRDSPLLPGDSDDSDSMADD